MLAHTLAAEIMMTMHCNSMQFLYAGLRPCNKTMHSSKRIKKQLFFMVSDESTPEPGCFGGSSVLVVYYAAAEDNQTVPMQTMTQAMMTMHDCMS